MKSHTKRMLAVVSLVLAMVIGPVALVACGTQDEYNDDRGKGDAKTEQQPDRPVKVWPNGDGFPNISAICIGGNGVYSTTGAPTVADMIVVVADDPECAEGGILRP